MRQLFIILFFFCSPWLSMAQGTHAAAQAKFNQVYRYMQGLYVDEVDMQPVIEGAIRGMLEELDPHSAYLTAEQMRPVQESFDGEFSGIGIEFNLYRDTVVVVNTIVGGPAEQVGMLPNDRIVRIDTLSSVGFKHADVPKYLRGPAGSKVEVEVIRRGVDAPLHFTIKRDKIPLHTIDAAYKTDEHTGYIKVNRFGHTTIEEFLKAYISLGTIDGLILDLRGNGGGLLDQAIALAGFFLPKDALIVSTEGRALPSRSFRAQSDGPFQKGRLVVLIDEASASASEIVAGAVQDWDRGIVIGRPSFGKGLVQRQLPLPDGSAVRLTVARYHTPTGRVIQRPYQAGHRERYYMDHYQRFGQLPDSLPSDTLLYKTLRTGRTVYGGGGILPDILVPADTTGVTPYLMSLVRGGVENEYIAGFLDTQRAQLTATYPSFEEFATGFAITESMLDGLTALAEKHKIPFVESEFNASKSLLQARLKAIIAQKLFDTTAFYRIINDTENVMYKEALEVMATWDEVVKKVLETKKIGG